MSTKIITATPNASLSVASTPEPLTAGSVEVWSVLITAPTTNVAVVYVGGSDINEATQIGVPIAPGESVSFDGTMLGAGYEPFNLNELYYDSASVDQELSFTYMKSDRTPRTRS